MFESIIRNEATKFLTYIFNALNGVGCQVSDFYLDHICYRVATLQEYVELKKELSNIGVLLADNEVNGREIAVYKLHSPIAFGGRKIDIFELPAPKNNTSYVSGFEHIEMVIPQDLRSFIESNTHLNFNTKGIDKKLNSEIRLNFKSGAVKFHRLPLVTILEKERG